MGRSPAPAPVTYVPEPQAPTVYQSLVPEEDFERASSYINELKAEREKTKAERYLEVGTPEEIGQRMKRRENITEAAYESSMPKPEIDYTAGLDPAKLNNLETFLKDFVDRRTGKSTLGTIKKGETAPSSAPAISKTDTAAPVRAAIAAPKPQPAPKPAPAPKPKSAPAPASRPAPAPAPAPKPKPAPAPPPEYYGQTRFTYREDSGHPGARKGGGWTPFKAPPGYEWARSKERDNSDDPKTTYIYDLQRKA